jgi:hypothetical protein
MVGYLYLHGTLLMIRSLALILTCLLITPASLSAADLESITPSVTLRDGSIPPQANVELFVFAGNQPNTTYTAVFNNVSTEPASVVALPATITSTSYDSGAQKLTVVLTHVPYVEGTTPPGPSTDFSIALVSASADGAPEALRGSWMATNISPLDWTLIPPTASNPGFGYQIAGPVGKSGFLRMSIPATMFAFASTLYGQNVTASDFAVFSGTTQTNVLVEALGNGGALVNVSVPFTSTNTEVTDVDEARFQNSTASASNTSVTKRITVGREADLSLSPNPSGKIKRNKRVNLFGCVASRVPFLAGERVNISLKRAGSSSATTIRGSLDANGCYRKSFKVASSGNATASLKRNTTIGRATTVKSKRLSIKVK